MLFERKFVKFNFDVIDKKDALKKICQFAKEINLINDVDIVYEELNKREMQSTTGFQDGFAIPHARSDAILEPAVLFIKFNKGIDWSSLDNKPTQFAFVLLIPTNASSIHLNVLSKISVALMNQEFVTQIKKSDEDNVFESIQKHLTKNSENHGGVSKENQILENKKVIALTGCPVGVAHTYLAAEKLLQAGKENQINIKVETHGSSGVKNELSTNDINEADVVIIASDIGLDLSRFNGKKLLQVPIKEAIHNPVALIDKALKSANIYQSKSQTTDKKFDKKDEKSYIMKHILAGISYMVPFVILGGICIALAAGLGKAIYGQNYDAPVGDFFYYLNYIGSTAFTLMIGALGAYIAHSIAGRAAIAPAFIISVLGNTSDALYRIGGLENSGVGMGFIGSILFGILIGYTVKWINGWNVPKSLSAIMPIFVIPLGLGLFYGLITIFVVGAPVAWVMNKFIEALESIFETNSEGSKVATNVGIGVSILIGILLGAMAGFDMGGPVNKVAFLTCTTLITSQIYEPMGMMAAAIPVAPLGMGLCTMTFRNKFNEEEKTMGVSAFIMGLIGISEGAIPFAISDPKKAIPCNVIGSVIAGGIAAGLGITDAAAHGGPIVAVLGAVSSNRSYGIAGGIGFYFLAIIIGTLVTCFLYGLIRNRKVAKISKKEKINKNNNKYSNKPKLNKANVKAYKNFNLSKKFNK